METIKLVIIIVSLVILVGVWTVFIIFTQQKKKNPNLTFSEWFLGKKQPTTSTLLTEGNQPITEQPASQTITQPGGETKPFEFKGDEPLFSLEESKEIPKIPDFPDQKQIDFKYPLIPPYTYAHIQWNNAASELVYTIEEPILTEEEKKLLEQLEEGIKELINLSFINVKDEKTVIIYLEKNIRVLLTELAIPVSKESFLKIMYYIYRDFVGLNDLEPLMNDPNIEDIECNGVKTPVYVVHRKFRNIRTSLVYPDIPHMAAFVEKLAQKCGKYISYADPILDGSLPGGSRVNATYSTDISTRGPTYSIRKFTSEPWSGLQLMMKGTVSAEMLAYLWMLIEYENSMMVIGGTGSGKTSLINAIAFFIPPQARVVTIEDTPELKLEHENWLPSVSRMGVGNAGAGGQKHGEVTLFDLLKASFRQRPDYIIVGEVRGAEASVLMQSAASGHACMGTMHAESVDTMVRRLQTPPISLSGALIESLAGVAVMQPTKVKGQEVRRLTKIDEIVKVKENLGGSITNTVFKWIPQTDTFAFNPNSNVIKKIGAKYGLTEQQVLLEMKRRSTLLRELLRRNVTNYKDVQRVINLYYKDPKTVLKAYGIKI